ncbi:methionine biosynthesis protein MetW [Emcibacter sp.]|uniref:methionine biosynthesis protein MetW n=1 Tax=Emcibacter sp. TaxID=1979954 RepID=UPI002AA6C4BC|nr:methionine biosynthesis protein MetW [Emcibacter sp.]
MNRSTDFGPKDIRVDLLLIADMIGEDSSVLDVGCGDGVLLNYLVHQKNVDGRGIEISPEGVNKSIAKGLSVIQGDAERDIAYYPDNSFDVVILSHTLQAMSRPDLMLDQLLRVGRKAIVSFPNFGHWRVRGGLLLNGTMPVTKNLDHPWYSTPNIHFCTIRDFVNLCREKNITIEKQMAIDSSGHRMPFETLWFSNILATQGLFVISRSD